jgi:hypothetical protein
MPLAGFEPTIPVFERAKIFHALDRAATVTGLHFNIGQKYSEIVKCAARKIMSGQVTAWFACPVAQPLIVARAGQGNASGLFTVRGI